MSDFSLLITEWYRQNKRELPWRQTTDPYKIWLSEIILQQTRVEQGKEYYLKFVRNYPTVHDLALTDERQVLNDWQGLGYYSRARNLHFSAKYISNELGGVFPSTYDEIINLKGVGAYTAAAIASFGFGETKAVVDGNVYRVLSRIFDLSTPIDSTQGKKEFQQAADELISPDNPGEHNQAMMELGSLICTPNPKCDECPVSTKCLALANDTIKDRPVKSKKTKVRERFFHYQVFESDKHYIIEERTKKDVWQHLFQFPLIETQTIEAPKDHFFDQATFQSESITHILSHQHIRAVFHHIPLIPEMKKGWIKIEKAKIQDYPLPRIIDRYLEGK